MVAVNRLVVLQTFKVDQARNALIEHRIAQPRQLPTIRGKILDRNGNVLALDKATYYLHVNYQLIRYMDPRWQEGMIRRAMREEETHEQARQRLLEKDWKEPMARLEQVLALTGTLANVSDESIQDSIGQINNQMWRMAQVIYWRRRNPKADWSAFAQDEKSKQPENIVTVDLIEMHQNYPLIKLEDEQDRLRAERAIIDMHDLEIKPRAMRYYPYETAACQILGWVAPGQEAELELFKDDKYRSYQPGEVLGKFGLERVYEPVLRGTRGEVIYDVEGNLLKRVEPIDGQNIQLTLDIDLQQRIEHLLEDPHQNNFYNLNSAAVVLETASNDILAIASSPGFDLNKVREEYGRFFSDPNKPLRHRALEFNYPPGSTAKPLITIAGLEEDKMTPDEVIHCSCYTMPPRGWPKCIMQWKFDSCHDIFWENNARNAIRGSCNIYFSQIAHRLGSDLLQEWFFIFGFGQTILETPLPQDTDIPESYQRGVNQSYGSLIYGIQSGPAQSPQDLPAIPPWESKFWGIGQGSLRVTVLQVANALSAIERDGIYKSPRLVYLDSDPFNESNRRRISISPRSLSVVRDGMKAVVYETNGTAYRVFNAPQKSELFNRDMTIYGKTGSTQNPAHAWFEAFAEDSSGRGIVVVVLVEGGQSGSGVAAPLGKAILEFCNESGYIGIKPTVQTP